MELNTPSPSFQNPDSDLSFEEPPAQPFAEPPPQSLSQPFPQDSLFHRIRSYPFHIDQEYLLGLSAIFGHPDTLPTAAELSANKDLVLQAQCFYFARKFSLPEQINTEAYKRWLNEQSMKVPAATTNGTNTEINPGINDTLLPRIKSPEDLPPRPSAPTPDTAAAASTLPVQPNFQPDSQLPPQPSATAPATASEGPAPPYPTTFAEIVDLITQNKPIPGIETVPDTVLEPGTSKVDQTARRRKPWEKDDGENEDVEAKEEVVADTAKRIQTGQGVMKILRPDAIPDSGLLSKD